MLYSPQIFLLSIVVDTGSVSIVMDWY